MSTNREALMLVDEMRKRGVRSFTIGNVSCEFAPAEPTHVAQPKAVDEDLCKCGHSLSAEHQNGFCIAQGGGCDPTKCAPAEKQ